MLAGLDTGELAIRAQGELAEGLGSLESLLAGIDLQTPGLDDLFNMRQISLDQILDAILVGLDQLAAEGSVIYQKLPGLNQSAAELLGGGTDLIVQLRGAVNSFRNGDLGTLQDGLNEQFNAILGIDSDPFSLNYQDSRLLMDLSFEKILAGAEVAFALDLADIIDRLPLPPLPGDFSLQGLIEDNVSIAIGDAQGQIHLSVEGLMGVNLGFGFDFTNVLDPQSFISAGSSVYVGLQAGTQQPVDFEVQLDLGSFGKVGFLIDDATADIRLDVGYALANNQQGSYSLGEVGSSDLEVSVGGRAAIDLPLFLTPELPVGGSLADGNADGFADNVLHAAVEFADGKLDFEVAAPYMDQLFNLAAILNDPAKVLSGLETMFDVLQSDLQAQFSALQLPLVESALSDAASFVGDLRGNVLGIKLGDTYTDGRLGQKLQAAIANGESVIELVQRELFAALSNVDGLNLLRMQASDALGNLLFDQRGKPVFVPIETADEIGLVITEDSVQFNLFIADTVFRKLLPLSFDASAPGLGLKTSGDAGLVLDLSYVMGLGFGISASDLVYLDTSGVADSGAELSLTLDASLTSGSELEGQLGFLRVTLQDADDVDGPSGLFGEFEIDLRDNDDNGRWALLKAESLDITARLTAVANADLLAEVDIPVSQGLELPKLRTVLRYDQVFAEVELGSAGSSNSFGQPPSIVFEDVTLDLGQFVTGFVGPIIEQVDTLTRPLQPIVKALTDPIPLLVQLGSSATSLLDLAATTLGPTKYAPTVKAVRSIADAIAFVETVQAFANSGVDNIEIKLGTFNIGGDLNSPGGATPTPAAGSASPNPQDDIDSSNATSKQKTASKNVLDKIGTTKGSFQFPLLTDPLSAVGLLLGKDANLFSYDLPGLDLDFKFVRSIPVFPGLNVHFGGSVGAQTDFSFGFDTTGLRAWADGNADGNLDFQGDVLAIFDGFYLDDNVSFDPNYAQIGGLGVVRTDGPEVQLSSSIVAGASVGVSGLVEAGVEGGIRGAIEFDLNDIPSATSQGRDLYDGKLRFNELLTRVDQGPSCMFDTRGKISAFLDAFFWVGLDISPFGKVTIFEARKNFVTKVLASFKTSCPDPLPADIASLDNGILNLRYISGDGKSASRGEAYTVSQEVVRVDPLDPNNSSTHERIVVRSRGSRQEFDPALVQTIVTDGTQWDDDYEIRAGIQANIELNGGAGNDLLQVFTTGAAFSRVLVGGAGDDTILGSADNDTIDGGEGNDEIFAGDGADLVYGGAGQDRIAGEGGNDTLFGESPSLLVAATGVEYADLISGGAGDDTLDGGLGDDVLGGEEGNDTLLGGHGSDGLDGGPGHDVLHGGENDDFLRGDLGNDELYGEAGEDTLSGGAGNDRLLGGADSDTLLWSIGDGSDLELDGGDSADTLKLEGSEGRIDEMFTLARNLVDPSRVDIIASTAVTSSSFVLTAIERVSIEAGEGRDSITVDDLSGTSVAAVDVDFGRGEILETVTVLEERAEELSDGSLASVLVPRVFQPDDAFDDGMAVRQNFSRQLFVGGQYQFDENQQPLLVPLLDLDGNQLGRLVQQNVGGEALFDSDGQPQLEDVQTRTIQQSQRVLLPAFEQDENGAQIPILVDPQDPNSPQLMDVFITPEFGIDSQPDVLTILGTQADDNFTVTTGDETTLVSQAGGTLFSISNARRTDDRIVLETLGGSDPGASTALASPWPCRSGRVASTPRYQYGRVGPDALTASS